MFRGPISTEACSEYQMSEKNKFQVDKSLMIKVLCEIPINK